MSFLKLKLKFHTKVGFYPDRQRFGYLVYEASTGKDVLSVASAGCYLDPTIALLQGMKEAEKLEDIFTRRLMPQPVSLKKTYHASPL